MPLGILSSTVILGIGLLAGLSLLAGGALLFFRAENRTAGIILMVLGVIFTLCPLALFLALILGTTTM